MSLYDVSCFSMVHGSANRIFADSLSARHFPISRKFVLERRNIPPILCVKLQPLNDAQCVPEIGLQYASLIYSWSDAEVDVARDNRSQSNTKMKLHFRQKHGKKRFFIFVFCTRHKINFIYVLRPKYSMFSCLSENNFVGGRRKESYVKSQIACTRCLGQG